MPLTSSSRSGRASGSSLATSLLACATSMRSRSTTTRAGADGRARRARERPHCLGRRPRPRHRDLRPVPTKLVANLPYNIATPLVVESLEHAASLRHWCVMVQQEVADVLREAANQGVRRCLRSRAAQRTKDGLSLGSADGLSSASAGRLRTRRVRTHGCGDTDRDGQTRRRGCLRASPEDTGQLGFRLGPRSASRAEEALTAIGRSTRVRAEELQPEEFVELAERLR